MKNSCAGFIIAVYSILNKAANVSIPLTECEHAYIFGVNL